MAAYHHLRFNGSVDIARYPEFREAFEQLPRAIPVLVDLTAAESADSTFLTELLMAMRRHTAPFAVLIAPVGNLRRMFEIANLGERMNVYTDLSAAVDSLGITKPTKPDPA